MCFEHSCSSAESLTRQSTLIAPKPDEGGSATRHLEWPSILNPPAVPLPPPPSVIHAASLSNRLSTGRLILWCYFIWYCVVLVRYFDANLRLWLTSLGLSIIIAPLFTSAQTASSANKVKLDFWQTFRLFLMPFCVSSFAALVKGKGLS